MRLTIANGLLLVAMATAVPVRAQTPESPDEIVATARDQANIRGDNSPPFHLHAAFQAVLEDGAPGDGTFDLTWISPGNWKDQIDVRDIHLTRTSVNGKLSEDPQPHYVPIQVDWIRNHVLPALSDTHSSPKTDLWMYAKQKKPGVITLIRKPSPVANLDRNAAIVIDAATGNIVWFDGADYSDFKTFLGKQVAMAGKCVQAHKDIAAFVIRKLETTSVPQDDGEAPKSSPSISPPILPPDVHAEVIHAADPSFSEKGRLQRINGTVSLSLGIDDQGKLREVQVRQSLEPSMDAEAVKAARKYVFKAAQRDGHPVPCIMFLEISFQTSP